MSAGALSHEHDYGYDLAHGMKVVARMPQQRRGTSRPIGAPARELDPDTDLGHDMAHEI